MGWRHRHKPIAEATSVQRIVPLSLPSRSSNTQWNGLLRDMVDAALFRIGRLPVPLLPLVVTAQVRTLRRQYKVADRVRKQIESRLKKLGFGTDGEVHYTRRQQRETASKQAHEARIRATQAIRARTLTDLVGTTNPKTQQAILRRAAKQLEKV